MISLLIVFIFGIFYGHSQFLVANNLELLDGDVAISVIVNTISGIEQARIVISGPSNTWFGVGFDNIIMDGTYSIIAFKVVTEEIGEINIVEEVILGNHFQGAPLHNQTLAILADIIEEDRRTVVLQRPIDGIEFSFPIVAGSVDIISAKGAPNLTDFTSATGMDSWVVSTLIFEETSQDPIGTPTPLVPIIDDESL